MVVVVVETTTTTIPATILKDLAAANRKTEEMAMEKDHREAVGEMMIVTGPAEGTMTIMVEGSKVVGTETTTAMEVDNKAADTAATTTMAEDKTMTTSEVDNTNAEMKDMEVDRTMTTMVEDKTMTIMEGGNTSEEMMATAVVKTMTTMAEHKVVEAAMDRPKVVMRIDNTKVDLMKEATLVASAMEAEATKAKVKAMEATLVVIHLLMTNLEVLLSMHQVVDRKNQICFHLP